MVLPRIPLVFLGDAAVTRFLDHFRIVGLPLDVMPDADLLPGTLDLLILKAVSLGSQHGYGILLRIQRITGDGLKIAQGALYPALAKLERRKELRTEWGVSENNRRAKFYTITPTGRNRLRDGVRGWNRLTAAMSAALNTTSPSAHVRQLSGE